MIKIMVGINTLTSIDRLAYSNHCQFWFRLGRDYPDMHFALNSPNRMSIDRMRNMTAEIALINEMDYVLFLDDDVLIPHTHTDEDGITVPIKSVQRLIDSGADIAAGWTKIRGYPFENMFFKWNEKGNGLKKYPTDEFIFDDKGNIPCDAVGFSFCLIKTSLLRKMPKPYFVTGTMHTEDVFFCLKARDLFPDTTIVVDPMIKTGHIVGSEVITPYNVEAYKKFIETAYPDEIPTKDESTGFRQDDYVRDLEHAKQNS